MINLIKRTLSAIVLLLLTFYFLIKGSFFLIFFISFSFIVACYEWHMMSKKKTYNIYGFLFLFISFYTFYLLSNNINEIFFVFLICVSTDVGGYVFGKIFKGPRLTKISPNKTYAGMIGSYLLALVCSIIISNFFDYTETFFNLIFVTILISSVSQIGDIIISYFKRLSKIKNTGKIIPGHGGLLDRIDGMVFAFPIFYLVKFSGYLNI